MATKTPPQRRLFVLDTSVLMHDPTALFRFQEHDIVLPMAVLEELDTAKKGTSELARNVRQVSRFLDELLLDADHDDIKRGLPLPRGDGGAPSGKLYFDLKPHGSARGDIGILETALEVQRAQPGVQVTLVTKDTNLRIRATVQGVHAEDYFSDQVLDDLDLLYTGVAAITPEQWRQARQEVIDNRPVYRLPVPAGGGWHLNQCLFEESSGFEGILRSVDGGVALIEPAIDYRSPNQAVWGIQARNREQNFALNLLMDPTVDFVSLLGAAGTGKTLLALAAGLVQTMDRQRFREIIMTRVTVPLGEDIGYLPGTEEEKMTPWMGALMDNLEVLTQTEVGGGWARAATQDVLQSRIKIRSLNFMRGRTFLNKYIIVDEAQNLTAKQMKALITRAGPGTKIVCLGNVAQIDTPYLTETSSGLTYVVDRFKGWPHGGHITLTRGERSRLADFATEVL